MNRTIAVGITATALLAGPTAAAHAAEQPHKSKAEKRHARVEERRAERRAARQSSLPIGGGKGTKPAQDTTTTGRADPPVRAASSSRPSEAASRGVVSCAVTADRDGTAFLIHNSCDTPQTITISVQSQPGPWHVGLCQAGGCALLQRYDLVVQPGTHSISAQSNACWYQVDVKWRGRLIRSNHFVTNCKPVVPPVHPKPRPPVQTHVTHRHPKPAAHIEGHRRDPVASLPRTGGVYTAGLEGGLGLLFLGLGLRVLTPRKRENS